MPLRPYDETLLRRAFDVARRSREAGDHPFGSASSPTPRAIC